MADWLVAFVQLVYWLVGWLADWLVLFGGLADWLIGWLVSFSWTIGSFRLEGWLIG